MATFDIREFGAVGADAGIDTAAIQSAVDACHAAGGGTVSIPPGRFRTGTVKLKSNVEFLLDKGAVILGSTSLADYATDIQGAVEAPAFDKCLFYAENARNIAIVGPGVIDGCASPTVFPSNRPDGSLGDRPMLMRWVDCESVTFSEVTLKDAGSWCVHMVSCRDVTFANMRIDSRVNPNNDGLDLDGCEDVLIENCSLRTGDDAVCCKSTTARRGANIRVRSCDLSSHTGAFKLGTSSRSGFSGLSIEQCRIHDCRMGVIKLLMVDGGVLEDIRVSDLAMTDVEGPLFIRLGNRGRLYDRPREMVYDPNAKPEGAPTGVLRNILVRNIQARITGGLGCQGIMITGIPGHPVENVTMENLDITFPGGGTAAHAAATVPEDVARYPEQCFFGVLPAWGLYARHVRGLHLDHVRLRLSGPDARPAIRCDDVDGFTTTG